MAGILESACGKAGVVGKRGGTYLCMEGPQFSTRAESNVYRGWGMDVIGMTNLQEAKLAREAEICYATMAHITDYDVWHESEAPVTVEMVIQTLNKNTSLAQEAVRSLVKNLKPDIEYKKRRSYYRAFQKDEEYFVSYFIRRYLAVHKKRYLIS